MKKFITQSLNLVIKSCKKRDNINTISNVVQSATTLTLFLWAIHCSPLSDFREVEREKLNIEVANLTTTKVALELEIINLKKTRQDNEKYLNYLIEISCSDFIAKIERNLQEYKDNYHLVSSIYSQRIGYSEYLENDKKLDEKLKSLKEEEIKCWTQGCYTDINSRIKSEYVNSAENLSEFALQIAVLKFSKNRNGKSIKSIIDEKEEISKSILAKFDEYNLFQLIKRKLDDENFSLVLPDKKELLRKKIAIFLSSNVQTLSKPLMIKTSFDNKPSESEIEKVDKNYSEAFSKLVELKNIMLSTALN
jgi:hypothetical protein